MSRFLVHSAVLYSGDDHRAVGDLRTPACAIPMWTVCSSAGVKRDNECFSTATVGLVSIQSKKSPRVLFFLAALIARPPDTTPTQAGACDTRGRLPQTPVNHVIDTRAM